MRADGRGGLIVEDRLPVDAAVGRLPDAAGGGGGVVGERIAGHAARAVHAAAGGGADRPKLEALEFGRAALRLVGVGQARKDRDEEDEDAVPDGMRRTHVFPNPETERPLEDHHTIPAAGRRPSAEGARDLPHLA